MTRIAHVVTTVDSYAGSGHPEVPTGLWLSELSHAWEEFAQKGYEQVILSPRGGACPLEPRSLKVPYDNASARAWRHDEQRMALLESTLRPDQVRAEEIDAIYLTGGHGVMFDFPDDAGLQTLIRDVFERGAVVSSVCHGYCGLLNVRLSDGTLLLEGREITGFSWTEEKLARVAELVPFNAEQAAVERGARYGTGLVPMTPHAVVDGNLVTGQNPTSAQRTARRVIEVLEGAEARREA